MIIWKFANGCASYLVSYIMIHHSGMKHDLEGHFHSGWNVTFNWWDGEIRLKLFYIPSKGCSDVSCVVHDQLPRAATAENYCAKRHRVAVQRDLYSLTRACYHKDGLGHAGTLQHHLQREE